MEIVAVGIFGAVLGTTFPGTPALRIAVGTTLISGLTTSVFGLPGTKLPFVLLPFYSFFFSAGMTVRPMGRKPPAKKCKTGLAALRKCRMNNALSAEVRAKAGIKGERCQTYYRATFPPLRSFNVTHYPSKIITLQCSN